jgi:S1-C subfamily serine protease
MRGKSFWPLLSVCLACSGTTRTASPKRAPLSAADIAKLSSPAIVFVEAGDGVGTGFIIDKSGLIATNLHVVRGKNDIKVKLFGGEIYPVMDIAGVDSARDLALLRIRPAKVLPALRLGDSDAMAAGDQVVAIGNPLGVFENSVSSGLVSQVRPVCTPAMVAQHNQHLARFDELNAKSRRTPQEEAELSDLQCSQELKILQISAPISQGSSGGPLFNQYGEVVGITTAIITAGQNINLAIPANYLKPIVAQRATISLEEFAKKTAEVSESSGPPEDGVKIERKIPDHPVSVLDGCSRDQIAEVVKSIWDAIEVGAPLYNAGNVEACYRIYEGTATKYEQNAPCKGIKAAFGDGLLRAGSIDSYKAKAWAMRDTFDGLIAVAEKWAKLNQGSFTPPKKK